MMAEIRVTIAVYNISLTLSRVIMVYYFYIDLRGLLQRFLPSLATQ